ncbi:hypothetical protein [Amaricoccus sp.]|uniref:hypothetical protein n=1 Tax=Amaricoccus sp. TaxID=1872485 RepID=UPI001B415CE1|nr:hypothetical protein [Amaricoccus sp.]MBP7001537.1 hypothetical protein [Amaricoccus sp.]
MYRILSAAAAVVLGFAAPGMAEEVSVAAPGVAASLHEGPLDMVAYYGAAPEGAPGSMEVVATFAPKAGRGGHALRIAMALGDGDRVAFALPGYPATRYVFAREGGALTVAGETALRLALAE